MASVTAREVDWKLIYCPESLVLPDCFIVSLNSVCSSQYEFYKRATCLLSANLRISSDEREMQAGEGEGTP